MKTKVAIVLLVLFCVALCIGLVSMKNQASAQHDDDIAKYQAISNQLAEVNRSWEEEKQLHISLQQELDARKSDMAKLSNTLNQTSLNLEKTQAALKAEQEEVAARDKKITELENQNATLDKQAVDLKTSIGDLETQIADTKKKLDASEGDKAFLTKELNRLMAEKSQLERQFNDLAVLRTQVHKLKEELATARRLDWIRRGIYAMAEEKGAQRLMQHASLPATTLATAQPAVATNADLNVEVHSDGTVTKIAPLTNPPPVTNPPSKQ
ncbi:MAG TPA: hypothetical protein VFB72_09325 [Verrucomicrobiae bacterium]|nr:hypothetical protein [Verrucomicrobiae bacterium]